MADSPSSSAVIDAFILGSSDAGQLVAYLHTLSSDSAALNTTVQHASTRLLNLRTYANKAGTQAANQQQLLIQESLARKVSTHDALSAAVHDSKQLSAQLTEQTRALLLTNSLQLDGVVALLQYLHSPLPDRSESSLRQKLLYDAMHQHLQQTNALQYVKGGLSVADVWFSQVETFIGIIPTLTDAVRVSVSQLSSAASKCHALGIANQVIEHIYAATTSATQPEQVQLLKQHLALFTLQPHVLSSIQQHLTCIASTFPPSSPWSTLRAEITNLAMRISKLMLDQARAYSGSATFTDDRYTAVRSSIILALQSVLASVPPGSPERQHYHEQLYQFAEHYQDFAALVQMAAVEPVKRGDARLVQYLTQFGQQFASVLFASLGEQQKYDRLLQLNQPAQYAQWLQQYLDDKPHLAWLHQIGQKQYQEAADTIAAHSSAPQAATLRSQQALLSVSKLSYFADELDEQSQQVKRVDQLLEVIDIDAYVHDDNFDVPPTPSSELIDVLLQRAEEENDTDALLMAMQVAQVQYDDLHATLPTAEYTDLLLHIWQAIVVADDWTTLLHMRQESIDDSWILPLRQTTLYRVLRHLTQQEFYNRSQELAATLTTVVTQPSYLPTAYQTSDMRTLLQTTWHVVSQDSSSDVEDIDRQSNDRRHYDQQWAMSTPFARRAAT